MVTLLRSRGLIVTRIREIKALGGGSVLLDFDFVFSGSALTAALVCIPSALMSGIYRWPSRDVRAGTWARMKGRSRVVGVVFAWVPSRF